MMILKLPGSHFMLPADRRVLNGLPEPMGDELSLKAPRRARWRAGLAG
jgi:hypothetical protein